MRKKRILYIIPWLPYPITTGGHLAIYSGIKAIVDDYDISLVYETWNNREYEDAKKAFQREFPNVVHLPLVHAITKNKNNNKLRASFIKLKEFIWALVNKRKILEDQNPVNSLIKKWQSSINPINEWWQSHLSYVFSKYSFDIVQVEMPWFLPVVFNLPDNVKKVYVHHELGFIRRELELKRCESKDYVTTYKRFIDFNEVGQLNRYDCVVTLSEIDAYKLKIAGVNKPVSPSFVSLDCSNTGYDSCDGRTLVFIGPDYHTPNLLGLSWFLENCWEKLLKKDESYKLKIIGKWSKERISQFRDKYRNLSFTGFVENLEKELKGCIMIVPILIGSGIRIKILEACSQGVPFVSTSVGAEGIPLVNGSHCFITDDVESFVNDIILLQEVELQKKFVSNSRKMIEDHYSLEALRKNRINIYESLF